jgi:hypothetical protein
MRTRHPDSEHSLRPSPAKSVRAFIALALAAIVGTSAAAGCGTSNRESTGDTASAISRCQAGWHPVCDAPPDPSDLPGAPKTAPHVVCHCEQDPVVPPPSCTSGEKIASQTVSTARAVYSATSTVGVGEVTTQTNVTIDGATYVSRRETYTGKAFDIDVTYGAPALSPIHLVVHSNDGSHMSGTMNGRSVTGVVGAPGTLETYTFADGQPAPSPGISPDIQDQLKLLASALATAKCAPPTSAPDAGVHDATLAAAPRVESPTTFYPNPTTNDQFYGSSECESCRNKCSNTATACGASAAVACAGALIFYGACDAAAMAACATALIGCSDGCESKSGSCHPSDCGNDLIKCAAKDDQCTSNQTCCPKENKICGADCCTGNGALQYGCNPNAAGKPTGGCCPLDPVDGQWTNPCGPTCCGSNEQCANANMGLCCSAGHAACGGGCCNNPGDVCADKSVAASGHDDWCCPAGQGACNGDCCPTGQCRTGARTNTGETCCATELCNGVCCGGGACVNGACCFGPLDRTGRCCGLGETVVNGECCAQGQACGSTCCAEGLTCLNAATSKCGTPTNGCTAGKVTCDYGNTSYCCLPGQNCNGSSPGCCGGSDTAHPCIIH